MKSFLKKNTDLLKDPSLSMTGKVCMITGANSGIGKEVSSFLASRGATIIMVCRDARRGEEARLDIIKVFNILHLLRYYFNNFFIYRLRATTKFPFSCVTARLRLMYDVPGLNLLEVLKAGCLKSMCLSVTPVSFLTRKR